MTSTQVHGATHLHALTLIKHATPNSTTTATEKVFHPLLHASSAQWTHVANGHCTRTVRTHPSLQKLGSVQCYSSWEPPALAAQSVVHVLVATSEPQDRWYAVLWFSIHWKLRIKCRSALCSKSVRPCSLFAVTLICRAVFHEEILLAPLTLGTEKKKHQVYLVDSRRSVLFSFLLKNWRIFFCCFYYHSFSKEENLRYEYSSTEEAVGLANRRALEIQ